MKKILILLLAVVTFSGCEKDDICDANTPTTPRIVLEFYDSTSPTVPKNVSNLIVTGVGQSQALGTFSGVSKIRLPLKTTEDNTQYSLLLHGGNLQIANEDFLQFNYTRKTVFVSRACGYKTIFKLNSSNAVVKTEPTSPDGFWIQNINISTTEINNENETHIKIYF